MEIITGSPRPLDGTGAFYILKGDAVSYHISRVVDLPFEQAVERTVSALKEHGFGVLTEIDVRATLKKKLDVDFRPYVILGACNPAFAHKALLAEDRIGAFLPCNVIVQERGQGRSEVSAVDPIEMMKSVDNQSLAGIAGQVRDNLRAVVEAV